METRRTLYAFGFTFAGILFISILFLMAYVAINGGLDMMATIATAPVGLHSTTVRQTYTTTFDALVSRLDSIDHLHLHIRGKGLGFGRLHTEIESPSDLEDVPGDQSVEVTETRWYWRDEVSTRNVHVHLFNASNER